MENYDSRQQDGGNFGEVREDAFADPFDGEAVEACEVFEDGLYDLVIQVL